jgi:hypothetical protein
LPTNKSHCRCLRLRPTLLPLTCLAFVIPLLPLQEYPIMIWSNQDSPQNIQHLSNSTIFPKPTLGHPTVFCLSQWTRKILVKSKWCQTSVCLISIIKSNKTKITQRLSRIGTHWLTRKTFHFGASSKTSSKTMPWFELVEAATQHPK